MVMLYRRKHSAVYNSQNGYFCTKLPRNNCIKEINMKENTKTREGFLSMITFNISKMPNRIRLVSKRVLVEGSCKWFSGRIRNRDLRVSGHATNN